MTREEIKKLIETARSMERECKRMKDEIEARRQELLSVKSSVVGKVRVMESAENSMPEYVYFALEELYKQYSAILQQQCELQKQVEIEISKLDPIEQEIFRATVAGKTEREIGAMIGYTDRTVRNYKRKLTAKLAQGDG